MNPPLRLLLVDDEPPARVRLRDLLEDLRPRLSTEVVAEAGDGVDALERIDGHAFDVALVDIRMPRMDGLELALQLARLPDPPAVIFVTAYDQYAVKAFELAAVDYLMKPVRRERLGEALGKIRRGQPAAIDALRQLQPEGRRQLRSSERGRVILIPVDDVLYLKAELKYVTARTSDGEFLIEDSLAQLEAEFGERYVRVHRNCLVARKAIGGSERAPDADGDSEPRWQLLLRGCSDRVPVSRRQWPIVKALIRS